MRLPDHTSKLWCSKVVLLVNTTLRCILLPRRHGEPLLISTASLHIGLPGSQGQVSLRSSLPRVARAVPFHVISCIPRRAGCSFFQAVLEALCLIGLNPYPLPLIVGSGGVGGV